MQSEHMLCICESYEQSNGKSKFKNVWETADLLCTRMRFWITYKIQSAFPNAAQFVQSFHMTRESCSKQVRGFECITESTFAEVLQH